MFKKMNNKKGTVSAIVVGAFVVGITVNAWLKGYGKEPVKNCPGTHVNDNCAHLKIEDL